MVTGHWSDKFIVIFKEKTCKCMHWVITCMLCSHAVSIISDNIGHGVNNVHDLEVWVHPCYWLGTWSEMHKHKTELINGRVMWPKSSCPTKLITPKLLGFVYYNTSMVHIQS
uniref:SWIM-type domain-containing protein n=1 Tax=Lactuca sativa TaxID=4236 RepID=A0A9R1V4Q2_LACSA|nr:hypothetical protein LSAT_V11C700367360 [Lactuca sativa]